jgi:acyl-CoA thioesterase I
VTVRVCVFGDSLVNGTGDDACLGWVGRVGSSARKAGADLTVYNLGVRRDTSADIQARWRHEAEARLPAGCNGRLIFSFGVNDCAAAEGGETPRIGVEQSLQNARAILQCAGDWLPTLMIGPPPITASQEHNRRISDLSEGLQAVCEQLAVPFLSTVAFAAEHCGLWRGEADQGDGVHPNAGGYSALAGAVSSWGSWRAWLGK